MLRGYCTAGDDLGNRERQVPAKPVVMLLAVNSPSAPPDRDLPCPAMPLRSTPMSVPQVSSSLYRWLVPYWADLHRQSAFFPNLAPELQAQQLAAALEADHPATAQEIREWNATTRRAMLSVLDGMLHARQTARQETLWTMTRGTRQVECVVVYTSVGCDLRLLERGDIVRTQLFRDAWVLEG